MPVPSATAARPPASGFSAAPGPLRDRFGRIITDTRISITDRCNYRCVYCREGGEEAGQAGRELSWDDWRQVLLVLRRLGIRKLRFTGGEPLLRRGLIEFIASLAPLGFEDLALTTNGHLLAAQAAELRRAGLQRITVSLDSVQPEKFARIARVPGAWERVRDGIAAAQTAGLEPVKINAVLLRGFNDDEIEAFAEFARRQRVVVRFIEFMPLEEGRLWTPEIVVTMREILERLQARYRLESLPVEGGETARRFRFADGSPGEIGIIAPVTQPFCGHCSRIRLTADGKLRTCLFSLREWPLAAALRAGGEELEALVRRAVAHKEERHHIGEPGFQRPSRTMVHIGG